jgi:protein-tyrosine phosphatase
MMLARIARTYSRRDTEGVFREIPLEGGVYPLYVSPMPFGAYDTRNQVLDCYRKNRVRRVFVLATDREIKNKAKCDLKARYEKAGIAWSQFPFADMTAPDMVTLGRLVTEAMAALTRGAVAIHCHAGVGRTSVGACCVVQAVDGLDPMASIAHVKRHMEVNMTAEQQSVVMRFRVG